MISALTVYILACAALWSEYLAFWNYTTAWRKLVILA